MRKKITWIKDQTIDNTFVFNEGKEYTLESSTFSIKTEETTHTFDIENLKNEGYITIEEV